MTVILFLYILLAQSRGPLFALGIIILGWTILEGLPHKGRRDRHRKKIRLVLLLISAVGVVLFMLYPDFSKWRIFSTRTYTRTHRLELWGQALLQAKDAPYFGHGLNADTRITLSSGKKRLHYHSVYVTTLFYGGIVGLLLLTMLVGSAIWQALTRTGELQKFLVTCMLVFGSLCIMTDGNTLIRHPKPVWIFFWFPIALVAASELPGNLLHDERPRTMGISNEVSAPG
jgi:O-antigen ligase